jgi:hypothetical protein
MHSARRNPVIRALVVLGITVFALILGAILLPPQGSNTLPRDGTGAAASTSPG